MRKGSGNRKNVFDPCNGCSEAFIKQRTFTGIRLGRSVKNKGGIYADSFSWLKLSQFN